MKRLGLCLTAILLFSSATQAADLGWNGGTDPMYSPSSAASWGGFYAGITGGYGWGTLTTRPAGGGVETQNSSGGWQAGGQAGYNFDLGGFVIGAEADLQWSNIGYSETIPAGTFTAGMDFFGSLRGRAGFGIGAVMPYVTGGVAAGRGSASLTDPGNVVTTQTATHTGWTVGGGLEAKATDNLTLRAEYLYVDLGTQTYNGLPSGNIDATHRFSVVRAGINYKF